ncbi:MAG TPA: hypothetical protein VM734_24205, partial [Kofleriaceae bacterium]|nr:hypothetical protein [Kofleriaceae bacterium]
MIPGGTFPSLATVTVTVTVCRVARTIVVAAGLVEHPVVDLDRQPVVADPLGGQARHLRQLVAAIVAGRGVGLAGEQPD